MSPRELSHPLHHLSPKWEGTKNQESDPPRTESFGTLILDLIAFITVRNTCLLLKSHGMRHFCFSSLKGLSRESEKRRFVGDWTEEATSWRGFRSLKNHSKGCRRERVSFTHLPQPEGTCINLPLCQSDKIASVTFSLFPPNPQLLHLCTRM